MYSNTERDPKCSSMCLIREMKDVNLSEVQGIEKLGGQYSWIDDYDYEDGSEYKKKMLIHDKYTYGFNCEDVIMTVTFDSGYYIVEFLTDLPLDMIITRNLGFKPETMTLKEAIRDFLDGSLSDGIGENEIGIVSYNNTTHEVWFGDVIEI